MDAFQALSGEDLDVLLAEDASYVMEILLKLMFVIS